MDVTNQITANGWKSTIFLVVFLVLRPINAQVQNEWTTNDSVRLAKILNGEIAIHIDDTFKRELEQSLMGYPMKNDKKCWDDFMLDTDVNKDILKMVPIDCNTALLHKSKRNNGLLNGGLKGKSMMIKGRTDKNLPFINVQQNMNMAIPLTHKLNFNLNGSYTQYKRNSVMVPATAIPYSVGSGFSYNVGKNTLIGTQTNYQYNIIQKDWEWFCGLRLQINF